MTWKEIKLATLQKMYSAEGSNIPSDDSSRDYLASMIPAANEGLVMMCTDKKHNIKSVEIDSSMGDAIGGFRRVRMKEQASDFYEFAGEVYYTAGSMHQRTQAYRRMSRTITQQTAFQTSRQACVPLSTDA